MPNDSALSGLTREVGGSSLGLAICKGIIEGHGGSIRAESEVGRGSTFCDCAVRSLVSSQHISINRNV